MITVEAFREQCGCRSVGECDHDFGAEERALRACVDAFAEMMKAKLIQKLRAGRSGWDNPDWKEQIERALRDHVDKGDPIDVANLAMMLWNFRQPTLKL